MDPNQFQMGKSKLFIKDPASVSQRSRLGEILEQRRFWSQLVLFFLIMRANVSKFEKLKVSSVVQENFAEISTIQQVGPASKFFLALHISPDQKLKKIKSQTKSRITILFPQLFLLEEVRERKFDHHARVGIFFQLPTIIPTSLLTNKQHFLFIVPPFKAEHPPGFWIACDQISNIQVIQKAFRKYFSRQKLLRQREAAAGENFFSSTFCIFLKTL